MPDPMRHSRYTRTRTLYLAALNGQTTCALCGQPVDTTLPGNHPYGPSIEHRLPVRRMRHMVQTWPELLALVCDTSLWAVAHRRCNNKQGGRSSAERTPKPRNRNKNSRQW